MMAIFTGLLIFFVVLLSFLAITRTLERRNQQLEERFRRAEEADFFRNTLAYKLVEMVNSPLTTCADWSEILPMCEYADELSDRTHQRQGFPRLATFVQQQMAKRSSSL